ncbi:MAG: hypothetical protein DRI77_15315, partial [Chloroflexi bacterium]
MELYQLTIHEARERLDAGEISSLELTEAVLERILAADNDVKAYLTLTPESALEQARAADARASLADTHNVGASLADTHNARASLADTH